MPFAPYPRDHGRSETASVSVLPRPAPCRWALNEFYSESNISAPFIASCSFDIRRKSPGRHFLPGIGIYEHPCFLFFLCFAFGFVVLVEFVEKMEMRLGIYAFSCLKPVAVVVMAGIQINVGLQYLCYLQRYLLIRHFFTSRSAYIYHRRRKLQSPNCSIVLAWKEILKL